MGCHTLGATMPGMKNQPTTCHHPEVIAVPKMDPLHPGYVHRCTACHQVVAVTGAAA